MKKLVLSMLVMLFFLTGSALSQVIADFEEADDGFVVAWGSGLALSQMADPTGLSAGVLSAAIDVANGGGAMSKANVEAMGAKLGTFFVYLPADAPDSLLLKVFSQDQAGWTWKDNKFYCMDLPKEVWYPLHADFVAWHAQDAGFDVEEGVLNRFGIEFSTGEVEAGNESWTGDIYIDNVSLLGVEPELVADFEVADDGFAVAWGSGLTLSQMADPTSASVGVLAADVDVPNGGGAMSKANIEAMGFYTGTFYVYLPADAPDSLLLKVFSQDQAGWTWKDNKFYCVDLPKEVWYPLHADFVAWHAQDSGFDVEEGALNRFGIEYSTGEVEAGNESWTGTIYIDNVNLFGIETGAEWVFADFENEAGGTQGFVNVTWNAGITNFTWAADPTGVSEGVLQSDWDFSIDLKDYIENNNVNLGWADTAGVDTGATAITVDVYLPEGFPMDHTMQISVVVRDHDTYDWIEDVYVVNPDTFTAGDWTTVSFDLLSHIEAEDINPFMGANVGVQIYDMSEASTWTGTIYWDNFTLIGVEEPVGDLVSPTVIASVEGTTYEYVHLGWTDNNLGTEKYRVFMSDSPITDIAAEGVYRIGAEIPHGTEYKNFRPFTTAAESKDYYFAVVAVSAVGEETALNAECVAGPITITTSPTAKVYYDANFAASFVLDGLDTEFTETYTQYALQPESASGDESAGWTIESTDMMFGTTFVIDDDYLYISANVTDDDLNADGGEAIVGGEAWMGDALEFYLGFYDHNFLTEWHEHGSVMSEGTGDVRISFCAWGEVQTASATYDFPGLESTVYESFFGDGYIIEARIALDSLALDGDMEVLNGTILPLRIDGTDLDPTNGDEGRTLLVGWGSSGGNAESWLRPSCWGYLEVINGPTGIEDEVDGNLPKVFRLYENFPNPFNPSTNVKFDLPKTADVRIDIYNALGQKIRTLINESKQAGSHTIQWDGRSDSGMALSSGIYFLKFNSAEYNKVQKLMLIK